MIVSSVLWRIAKVTTLALEEDNSHLIWHMIVVSIGMHCALLLRWRPLLWRRTARAFVYIRSLRKTRYKTVFLWIWIDDWWFWSLLIIMIKKDLFSKTIIKRITLNWLQMHCKDTMVELDVDPEDPEVLIMTCLVSTDQNSNDDNVDNLENPNGVMQSTSTFIPDPPREHNFGRGHLSTNQNDPKIFVSRKASILFSRRYFWLGEPDWLADSHYWRWNLTSPDGLIIA